MPVIAAYVPLGAGITTGVLGILGKNHDLRGIGVFIIVAGIPPLMVHTLRVSQRVAAHQLAEADNAGYWRALDHVARGLLDQGAVPPNGGHPAKSEQVAGNVITLRPNPDDKPKRMAQ
ncbi:hypothetical protein ACWGQL_01420 [Streptomyces lydicus]